MKYQYAFVAVLMMAFMQSVNAQVGIGTVTPQGALDISSTTNGMLIPRVSLTSLTTAAPVVNPQGGALVAGTLVYNQSPTTVAVGFYFWDGTKWAAIGAGAAAATDSWALAGNSNATSSSFVGTTNATELYFKVNGANKFRIANLTNQLLGYGGTSASPTYSWDGSTGYGMWLSGTNIRFSSAGTARLQIPNADQIHGMVDGNEALPFYSWVNATTTGMFKIGNTTAAQLAFATNAKERLRILANGDIGINNIAPKTKLEVAGAMSLNEGTALTLTNGVNSNVGLGTTPYSLYRITGPTGAFSIGGIVPATGADGQIVTIENTTAQDMTLLHQSSGSTAANQLLCVGAKDLLVKGQYATVTLQYNKTQARWIIKSYVGDVVSVNQREIYSVKGTNDISSSPTNVFGDMDQMTLTFTPKNSIVYVSFGASGDVSPSVVTNISQGHTVGIRIVNVTASNNVEGGSNSLSTDYAWYNNTHYIATGWNLHMNMFPVSVTPGVSTTIKLQWRSNSTGSSHQTLNNVSSNPGAHHRNLTIID